MPPVGSARPLGSPARSAAHTVLDLGHGRQGRLLPSQGNYIRPWNGFRLVAPQRDGPIVRESVKRACGAAAIGGGHGEERRPGVLGLSRGGENCRLQIADGQLKKNETYSLRVLYRRENAHVSFNLQSSSCNCPVSFLKNRQVIVRDLQDDAGHRRGIFVGETMKTLRAS